MGHADRHPEMSTQPYPDDRADQSGENQVFIDPGGFHDPLSHRVRHAHAEDKNSGEIPERRPKHCHSGREYTSGDDRRYRICRIVHPVQEVEQESDHDG